MKPKKRTDTTEIDARTRILDSASELLCEGTEELTIRDVALRAKVGLGLINYHFGTRDALLREAIRRYVNAVVIQPYRAESSDSPAYIPETTEHRREVFAAMLRGPVEFLAEHPNIARISIQFDLHSPKLDDNSDETVRRLITVIEAWFAGIQEKDLQEYRIRVFAIVASIHEAFLRPELFTFRTGLDYSREGDRDSFRALLARMVFP